MTNNKTEKIIDEVFGNYKDYKKLEESISELKESVEDNPESIEIINFIKLLIKKTRSILRQGLALQKSQIKKDVLNVIDDLKYNSNDLIEYKKRISKILK